LVARRPDAGNPTVSRSIRIGVRSMTDADRCGRHRKRHHVGGMAKSFAQNRVCVATNHVQRVKKKMSVF
jgi:hypothetical protein